jgi:hypothetical protein
LQDEGEDLQEGKEKADLGDGRPQGFQVERKNVSIHVPSGVGQDHCDEKQPQDFA